LINTVIIHREGVEFEHEELGLIDTKEVFPNIRF
jgi:hypothetical protein